jgi:hypothetical protein
VKSKPFDPYKKIANINKAKKKYSASAKGVHTARKSNLKRNYNLSIEEYNHKLREQQHKCAICGVDATELTKRLHVDHNHQTGKVRDLLCPNCNIGLGMFKESIKNIANAIAYLEKHKG